MIQSVSTNKVEFDSSNCALLAQLCGDMERLDQVKAAQIIWYLWINPHKGMEEGEKMEEEVMGIDVFVEADKGWRWKLSCIWLHPILARPGYCQVLPAPGNSPDSRRDPGNKAIRHWPYWPELDSAEEHHVLALGK